MQHISLLYRIMSLTLLGMFMRLLILVLINAATQMEEEVGYSAAKEEAAAPLVFSKKEADTSFSRFAFAILLML